MKNWHFKAILGALAVDLIGGQVLGSLVAIPFTVALISRGNLDPEAMTQGLMQSPAYLLVALFVGLAMDVLGGYLAAMWAPNRKIAHAAVLGVLSIVLGLLITSTIAVDYPAWFKRTWVLVMPAALLGGWWRVKKHGAESRIAESKIDETSAPAPIASPFGD